MNLRRAAWGMAALLLAGAFGALGAWQWQRGDDKERMLARWKAALAAPLVSGLAVGRSAFGLGWWGPVAASSAYRS